MIPYTKISYKLSRVITRHYSTSFSLGIRTLDRHYRDPVYAIYGFVRLADEIVDTFHAFDKRKLFDQLRAETNAALNDGISTNPVLEAFRDVVQRYNIDRSLIDAFLRSMEMDLTRQVYDPAGYNEYIYGSAEVIGLMCLKVFCDTDLALYGRLKEPARRLGSAFQKVNFLRDMNSDYQERGRIYFPAVNFERFDNERKKQIEQDIQTDLDAGYAGIRQLPEGSRLGVAVAYIYYLTLFRKIQLAPASQLQEERLRVNNTQKLLLLIQTWIRFRLRLV